MSNQERLKRLQNFNSGVQESDSELAEESRNVVIPEGLFESGDPVEDKIVQESIILKRTRPVLAISENAAKLTFRDAADSDIWKTRLEKAQEKIKKAAQAVGRIDLENAGLDWVGTGWLVHDEIRPNRSGAVLVRHLT